MGRTAAGRMINQDIALSAKVASLSPEALALFCLAIPHFNSHGKMAANPHVVKGTVCPLVGWLTVEKVEACLAEISAKTNVKWWRDERGLYYLQSLNWKEHQTLREDRLGPDHLPDYPGEDRHTPGLLQEYAGTSPAKGKGREEKIEGKKNIPPHPPKGESEPFPITNFPEEFRASEEFRRAWADWSRFRREMKKPLRPSTIERQASLLVGFGLTGAIRSIEQSITNGWTGLFESKGLGEAVNRGAKGFSEDPPPPREDLPDYVLQLAAREKAHAGS